MMLMDWIASGGDMGKRSWLETVLQKEVLPTIAQLEDTEQGRAAAVQLCEELRSGWAKRGFPELKQQQGLMDDTRRAIKQQFGKEHFSLECIGFSRDEGFELNRQKQQNARTRQLHQQFLNDPDAIAARAVNLLENSQEWAEVAAALAVVTGRRLNEVLRTAEFTVKSRWVVTFRGALKRREESVPLVFDIPVLTTAERVVRATERLRLMTPKGADESKVAQASDRSFGDLVPLPHGKGNLYSHLWRSVYCCIATFWYCPPHVDDLLFKAHIMGHFESLSLKEQTDGRVLGERLESFSSERHYRLYEIADSVIAYHKGKRKGIKLGHAGIEPLEVFVKGMPEHQPVVERKHPSSVRIWREDHDRLVAILSRFEGKNQADRVEAWLEWSEKQLEREQGTEAIDQVTGKAIAPFNELHQDQEHPYTADQENRAVVSLQTTPEAQEFAQIDERSGQVASALPLPLEQKMDKLIELMGQFVQGQLQRQEEVQPSVKELRDARQKKQTRQIKTTDDPIIEKPLKERQERPANVGRTRGGDDELVDQALTALIRYNDQPGRSHDEKWLITVSLLKKFTPNANQRAAQRVLDSRLPEVEAHHLKHHLQPDHNNRHKKHDVHATIRIDVN